MERERWEYWTGYLHPEPDRSDVRQFLRQRLEVANPPRYTPMAVLPELNAMGEDGWELVHMEPVRVGSNEDILITSQERLWSNAYFCVLKRRK